MSETFAVVLANPVIEDTETIQKVTDALSTATGMIPYDATRLAKNAQGVLIENISEFQARKIVSELASRGLQAGAADAGPLGLESKPRTVREIAVSDQHLSVQLGYAGMDTLPWGRVDMLSVCLYWKPPVKVVPSVMKTVRSPFMSIGAGMLAFGPVGGAIRAVQAFRPTTGEERSTVMPGEGEHYVVDIFLREPTEILRMKSNACSYSYLGDRLENNANKNMKLVIEDIAAKDVLLSPMAQQLMEGDTLANSKLDNLHLFDRYNRWVFLALLAFSGQSEAETSQGD
jgi:hypothetical protein